MAQFKGTKGKWHIDDIDICHDKSNDKGYGIVAQVYDGLDTHVSELEETLQKSNALLISKAPEMLDMLERVLAENSCTPDTDKAIEQLIKDATEI